MTRDVSGASAEPANTEDLNTGYELFILVLTVVSLILMALSLMPFNEAVQQLLLVYRTRCVSFSSLTSRRIYTGHQRGARM